ncbi:MAG: hypothetical protein TQ35_0005455 [Candidatus Aramenus sulfurataquae]|uniref:Uncharacterized protein n=2 Tax=Candidatus Aramenus sulfurataquae TaxID=1326980 RepID=A0AAE3K5E1_9CREN|nr:hypothetical protein [Candidatus Aramenus sulfurataquae]
MGLTELGIAIWIAINLAALHLLFAWCGLQSGHVPRTTDSNVKTLFSRNASY